jgi:hypothetical protein
MIKTPREILSRILGSIAQALLACATFTARLRKRVGFNIHGATNHQIVEYKHSLVGRFERGLVEHLQTTVHDRLGKITIAAPDGALWDFDSLGQDAGTADYEARCMLEYRRLVVDHMAAYLGFNAHLDPVAAPGHDLRTQAAQSGETLLSYLYERGFCAHSKVGLFQLLREAGVLTNAEVAALLERHPGFGEDVKRNHLGGSTNVS